MFLLALSFAALSSIQNWSPKCNLLMVRILIALIVGKYKCCACTVSPPYPYSKALLWVRITVVPPTFNGEVSRIWMGLDMACNLVDPSFFHIFHSFFPLSVVGSWQVLRLLFVWEAHWPNSSSEDPIVWMVPFFLVAFAIIVLTHCLICNPLLRLSKYLFSKGVYNGGSASLSAS